MNIKSQIVSTQYQVQLIKDAQYSIKTFVYSNLYDILTAAISNNLKYIVLGRSKKLEIWKCRTGDLIKSIRLQNNCYICKFTEDSQLLYVGTFMKLYHFYVNNKFKKFCKLSIHSSYVQNIYCITNTIILTTSWDHTIMKTDVNLKQQLYKIQAHNNKISGLDYNSSSNTIASGSFDYSIKLWNGFDGSLLINRQNAHNNKTEIQQVLFTINNKQLISLDVRSLLIIWNINYQTSQLEQLSYINECGYNISLVVQKQFIVSTGSKLIKVYTIEGDFVRKFYHEVSLFSFFNMIQHDSMKVILIQGLSKLQVCKLSTD